jgi:hypothetical protein
MPDEVRLEGLRSLVFELDDLRCDLRRADYGEVMFDPRTRARKEERVAELEELLDEDDVIAVISEGDEPAS